MTGPPGVTERERFLVAELAELVSDCVGGSGECCC